MSYTHFTDSTTAHAYELMDNFYWIGQGDRLPMSGTSLALAGTQSSLNIGSSAASWKDLYSDNLYVGGSISTADRSMWTLVASAVATTTVSSFEITGLNGDDFINYMAEIKCISSITSVLSSHYIVVSINHSVGSLLNTGACIQFAHDVTGDSVFSRNEIRIFSELLSVAGTNTSYVCLYGRIFLHGRKQDSFSPMISDSGGVIQEYSDGIYRDYYINGADETITSLHILKVAGGNAMNPGSVVNLWGRK